MKVLYLGFVLPPGAQAICPWVNPAGQVLETGLLQELKLQAEVRSTALLPVELEWSKLDPALSPGVASELYLADRRPELWYRYAALRKLQQTYRAWEKAGWKPEAILSYNMSPVYQAFLRWVQQQPHPPRLYLLLADSIRLGKKLSPWKRFRYQLKPFWVNEEKELNLFSGVIGLSQQTEAFSKARQQPWLWMPGGCESSSGFEPRTRALEGPFTFGYFGALAPHSGVVELVEEFLKTPSAHKLRLCGHGRLNDHFAELARNDSRLEFHGLKNTSAECLDFAQNCDVLVNPRPPAWGNENNFPSKIFQYALAGRAILTTHSGGVEQVLGANALYFDVDSFRANLAQALKETAEIPRRELDILGASARQTVLEGFTWARQATRILDFMGKSHLP